MTEYMRGQSEKASAMEEALDVFKEELREKLLASTLTEKILSLPVDFSKPDKDCINDLKEKLFQFEKTHPDYYVSIDQYGSSYESIDIHIDKTSVKESKSEVDKKYLQTVESLTIIIRPATLSPNENQYSLWCEPFERIILRQPNILSNFYDTKKGKQTASKTSYAKTVITLMHAMRKDVPVQNYERLLEFIYTYLSQDFSEIEEKIAKISYDYDLNDKARVIARNACYQFIKVLAQKRNLVFAFNDRGYSAVITFKMQKKVMLQFKVNYKSFTKQLENINNLIDNTNLLLKNPIKPVISNYDQAIQWENEESENS